MPRALVRLGLGRILVLGLDDGLRLDLLAASAGFFSTTCSSAGSASYENSGSGSETMLQLSCSTTSVSSDSSAASGCADSSTSASVTAGLRRRKKPALLLDRLGIDLDLVAEEHVRVVRGSDVRLGGELGRLDLDELDRVSTSSAGSETSDLRDLGGAPSGLVRRRRCG